MSIFSEWWFSLSVGLAASYFFYRKSLRLPKLHFAVDSIKALSLNGPNEVTSRLKMSFDGTEVVDLTVGTVTLWNSGEGTLEGVKIVARDPLIISVGEGGRIIETTVIQDPNPQCGIRVFIDESRVDRATITFDYLDHEDGVKIRVLHTSRHEQIQLGGTIKGVKMKKVETSDFQLRQMLGPIAGILILIFALTVSADLADLLWPLHKIPDQLRGNVRALELRETIRALTIFIAKIVMIVVVIRLMPMLLKIGLFGPNTNSFPIPKKLQRPGDA